MRKMTAALGLLLACMACSREADFSGMVPQPVILPAESYRTEILAIDRLVFGNDPVDDARRTELAAQLEGLAKRIVVGSDSRFLKLESLELRALAGRAPFAEPARSSESMQNEWMRIRNNLFEDRAWFARSAADLPPAEPAITAPVTASPVATSPHKSFGHTLYGQWFAHEIYGYGRLMTDSEISRSVWSFGENQLTIQHGEGGASRYSYEAVHDARGDALHLIESGSSGRAPAQGWMIYELTEDRLRAAFWDGLGERPPGFERTDGKSEPMLNVVVLTRNQ